MRSLGRCEMKISYYLLDQIILTEKLKCGITAVVVI